MYNSRMDPIHAQVLQAARGLAARDGTFSIADVVGALPHLNTATVRTHVASRCCADAPVHHASRYPYFRSVGRGVYRIEPAFCQRGPRPPRTAWPDRLLASTAPSVDPTLIAESLKMTPTDRLETMRCAAQSLDAMTARAS